MNMSSNNNSSDPAPRFCKGMGSVMANGFQPAFGEEQYCMLLFFKGWNVDTPAKYVGAIAGIFFLGFLIEAGSYARKKLSQQITRQKPAPVLLHYSVSFVYGCQMVVAYFAMLTIMLFEPYVLISLVFGLMVGHAFFSVFMHLRALGAVATSTSPRIAAAQDALLQDDEHTGHSPCCYAGTGVSYRTFNASTTGQKVSD